MTTQFLRGVSNTALIPQHYASKKKKVAKKVLSADNVIKMAKKSRKGRKK